MQARYTLIKNKPDPIEIKDLINDLKHLNINKNNDKLFNNYWLSPYRNQVIRNLSKRNRYAARAYLQAFLENKGSTRVFIEIEHNRVICGGKIYYFREYVQVERALAIYCDSLWQL